MDFHTTGDGCRLAYSIAGPAAAPAVLLANALGTDHRLFDALAAALADMARVIRYDARGHGLSDAPSGPYSIERLGRDALSLLDHTRTARADVCGVSIGGLTALWLGVFAPGRVRRLVLANTAARIGSEASWAERLRQVESAGVSSIADATMARWFTPGFRAAQPDTVARVHATLSRTPAAGYLGCCAALRDADLRADCGRVTAPTLVITGTHDVATPPEDGARLAAAISGASLVELDAAHLSNVECADAFNGAVARFLELEPGRA